MSILPASRDSSFRCKTKKVLMTVLTRPDKHYSHTKGREVENTPPTKDTVRQHVIRAGYQTGHVWGQVFLKTP